MSAGAGRVVGQSIDDFWYGRANGSGNERRRHRSGADSLVTTYVESTPVKMAADSANRLLVAGEAAARVFDGQVWQELGTDDFIDVAPAGPVASYWLTSRALYYHDGSTMQHVASLFRARSMWVESQGPVWVVDGLTIAHYNAGTTTRINVGVGSIDYIAGRTSSDMWLGTPRATHRFDGATIVETFNDVRMTRAWGTAANDSWLHQGDDLLHYDGSTIEVRVSGIASPCRVGSGRFWGRDIERRLVWTDGQTLNLAGDNFDRIMYGVDTACGADGSVFYAESSGGILRRW